MPFDKSILFSRKNCFYSANEDKWRRSMDAYGGGSAYIKQALIQHTNELPPEYQERLKRAFYVNYPRRVASMITQFVLATRPNRENANSDYEEDFSRTGMRVDEVMRQFSTYLNICGCAWLCVDAPSVSGTISKAEELEKRIRPYCVALSPLSVPDWCYGDDGRLLWVLTSEWTVDNADPFRDAVTLEVRKLWTRDKIYIVKRGASRDDVVVEMDNPIKCVPFVRHVDVEGYGINENHWFEDVVRISDSILNSNSEAQMNCLKQMFGLLVVPEDFLNNIQDQQNNDEPGRPARPNEPLSWTLARSAALFESNEAKGTARYIQPAGTETATIRSEADSLRKELYSIIGLSTAKEGTRLVESAEAKAWDFQHIEAYMKTRADILEQAEVKAWEFLALWDPSVKVPNVSYNRNFSILDLQTSVATLLDLSSFLEDNDPYQREIGKTALALLCRMRQIPAEIIEQIIKLIDGSTPGTDKKEADELKKKMLEAANDEGDGDDDETGGGNDDGGKGGTPPRNQIGFNR